MGSRGGGVGVGGFGGGGREGEGKREEETVAVSILTRNFMMGVVHAMSSPNSYDV